MSAWRYIVPHVDRAHWRPLLIASFCGALVAGCYGILHDQITFGISPEYFTKVKFTQFHFANVGMGDRIFVGTIGFLATAGVGAACGWFMGRRFLPRYDRGVARRKIIFGFVLILCGALLFGAAGFFYGLVRGPTADYAAWEWAISKYGIVNRWDFVRVAYIHNSGYLGAAVGFVIANLRR